jgi:hypothetical protein
MVVYTVAEPWELTATAAEPQGSAFTAAEPEGSEITEKARGQDQGDRYRVGYSVDRNDHSRPKKEAVIGSDSLSEHDLPIILTLEILMA